MFVRFENLVVLEVIEKNGVIIVVDSFFEVVEIVNIIVFEYLEICCNDVEKILFKIRSVGVIFIGEYFFEFIGDYIVGLNYVLLIFGIVSFFFFFGVYDFVKRMSLIKYLKE